MVQSVDFNLPSYQRNTLVMTKPLLASAWLMYAVGSPEDTEAAVQNLHTSTNFKNSKLASYVDSANLGVDQIKGYTPVAMDIGNSTMWKRYEGIMTNPRFAPLMADDLTNLPPAFVLVSESDALRDEGLLYAKRLEKAKVKVKTKNYRSGYHCMISLVNEPFRVKSAIESFNDIAEYLKQL